MSDPQQQIAEYLNNMIVSAMAAQAARVTTYWEPQALALTEQANGEAWGLILSAVDRPDFDLLELRKGVAQIVVRLSDGFKELLARMVTQETEFTAQMLTMHGTFGPMPEIKPDSPSPDAQHNRVDGADAVDLYLNNSFVEFMTAIEPHLAALVGADEKARKYRIGQIERATGHWRNRLATFARTTTHTIADRAKQSVNQALAA